jgi:hypothetical protein
VDTPSSYQASYLLPSNGGAASLAAPLSTDDNEPGAISTPIFVTPAENDNDQPPSISTVQIAPRTSSLVDHTYTRTLDMDLANPESETDYLTADQAQDDSGGPEEMQLMVHGEGEIFDTIFDMSKYLSTHPNLSRVNN